MNNDNYVDFLNSYEKFQRVSTKRLAKFINDNSIEDRKEILRILVDKIFSDDSAMDDFIDEFGHYIGLRGVDFDKLVHCSRDERKFWLEKKKLNILYYTSYPKMDGEYPVYDAFQALYEIPLVIDEWRKEYKEYKAKKREEYKKSDEYNEKKSIREDAKEEIRQLKEFWKSLPEEKALSLEIAYFLRLANHWAKTENVRRTTTANIYNIKNEFVRLLQNSSLASLYFYRPDFPDKIIYRRYHDEDFDIPEEFLDEVDIDYSEKVIKDYYSLYYLEIKYKDMKYSFHTPYPIGRDFFPSISKVPKIDHSEGESYDGPRFGRGMFDDEKVMYPRQTVMNRLKRLLPIAEKMWGRK